MIRFNSFILLVATVTALFNSCSVDNGIGQDMGAIIDDGQSRDSIEYTIIAPDTEQDSDRKRYKSITVNDRQADERKDITGEFIDANFLEAVREIIQKPTGEIYQSDLDNVTEIDISMRGIEDLTGIERFTSITWLDCSFNQLTSLDVSKNTSLTELRCSDNQLTSLNVLNNSILKRLSCNNNQLTVLDISRNVALTELYCFDNQLTWLDVSKNTTLRGLNCADNLLTTLDVSENTMLRNLRCVKNHFGSIDDVIGWQEHGLVREVSFKFDPQK